MLNRNKFTKFLLFGISLSLELLTLSGAQARVADWYRVEVVVFAYTEPDATDEWWYEAPGLPSRVQTISLLTAMAAPAAGAVAETTAPQRLIPYLALPRQEQRLAEVRWALAQSREYRPLLHVAWQQPGLSAEEVRAVRLHNMRDVLPVSPQESQTGETQAPQYLPPVQDFTGHVRLRSSRFLHLDVDLAYFPDLSEQPQLLAAQRRQSADYVRLTESRRIKLEQLHYFDHPLFGVIVQVSRQSSAEDDAD
ncbi:MAG: CsiV family protein [Gammaproteobacteria bacterium]|nr:CsiV family protein [Gammaproteobacteria bacterium]MCY4282317.1 CsiV family protein [Gammaproteobacteria bacterium]MCY4339246.1 CsiV family protein [Gammaproteobacteria bacterium]